MEYKLICVDIDGTLLNDDKKIPDKVKKSLQKASRMGIQIALISGRMPAGVEMVERELGVSCIKACNAGTCILLGDQCIHTGYLMPEIMRKIYMEFAVKNQIPLWIFQERKWFVTEMDQYIEQEIEIIHYNPEVVDAGQLSRQWDMEMTGPDKLLFAADARTIRKIQTEMERLALPGVDMARSADIFLEIFPKGATKGKALETICKKLNIKLQDTIAFGDQELDIPMIETAGVGIAMGNAIDELKERADFVTRSNNEAGIAYALEKFL